MRIRSYGLMPYAITRTPAGNQRKVSLPLLSACMYGREPVDHGTLPCDGRLVCRLVPVLAAGFGDILKRCKKQEEAWKQCQKTADVRADVLHVSLPHARALTSAALLLGSQGLCRSNAECA